MRSLIRTRMPDGKKAGKERVLQSSKDGINLFAKKKSCPGITHDNRMVPGWNNDPS